MPIFLLCLPATSRADIDSFAVGQFLTAAAVYDFETNTVNAADIREGTKTACFRVDKIEKVRATLTLVKGTYIPWWDAETTYKPDTYTDQWFTSQKYREKTPSADNLKQLFTAHSACP
ncbi:hypothetical protein OS189_12895 [Sulfitobacter sp. F26169L]|uniref:hypothetical protein n=1 Tax=Sulfitobacter sp. F26169L TaxID=2996015 RepID=UPI002260C24E|nr:hypothetical protein [Sulfitobacter sp. F26169L]MCX7567242.1 hypothetical protein [Sulfitobacter sp. F26169L]